MQYFINKNRVINCQASQAHEFEYIFTSFYKPQLGLTNGLTCLFYLCKINEFYPVILHSRFRAQKVMMERVLVRKTIFYQRISTINVVYLIRFYKFCKGFRGFIMNFLTKICKSVYKFGQWRWQAEAKLPSTAVCSFCWVVTYFTFRFNIWARKKCHK